MEYGVSGRFADCQSNATSSLSDLANSDFL